MKTTYTKKRYITKEEAPKYFGQEVEFATNDLKHTRRNKLCGVFTEGFSEDFYKETWSKCAILEEVDPRKVPKGVPALPGPNFAYLGEKHPKSGIFWTWINGDRQGWIGPGNCLGNTSGVHYAIDVTDPWAQENYPEICACYDLPTKVEKSDLVEKLEQMGDVEFVHLIKQALIRIAEEGKL